MAVIHQASSFLLGTSFSLSWHSPRKLCCLAVNPMDRHLYLPSTGIARVQDHAQLFSFMYESVWTQVRMLARQVYFTD